MASGPGVGEPRGARTVDPARRPLPRPGGPAGDAERHDYAEDVEGADLSGVSGTPTFFINGRRHHGAYDIDTLSRAVRTAGARATLPAS